MFISNTLERSLQNCITIAWFDILSAYTFRTPWPQAPLKWYWRNLSVLEKRQRKTLQPSWIRISNTNVLMHDMLRMEDKGCQCKKLSLGFSEEIYLYQERSVNASYIWGKTYWFSSQRNFIIIFIGRELTSRPEIFFVQHKNPKIPLI